MSMCFDLDLGKIKTKEEIMEEKVKEEIKNLLHKLAGNDPKAFEESIALKTRIITLVDVLTL